MTFKITSWLLPAYVSTISSFPVDHFYFIIVLFLASNLKNQENSRGGNQEENERSFLSISNKENVYVSKSAQPWHDSK